MTSLFLLLCSMGIIPTSTPTECYRRKLTAVYFGFAINNTLKCPMTFQWTVNDFCCYDKYDNFFEERPYCCYSDTYKLAVAVGFICLVLISATFSLFCCWFYNIPHHILYILTCRKFRLNDWLAKTRNGPYVDPSFYSGEPPFWAPGAQFQPYPLRPMPPRIFYPAPPANMKFRWEMGNADLPLFILASRQFHRNPYSARPNDRSHPAAERPSSFMSDSRRSSITTIPDRDHHHNISGAGSHRGNNSSSGYRSSMPLPFQIKMDEVEAAAELIESIRMMEQKSNTTNATSKEITDGQDGAFKSNSAAMVATSNFISGNAGNSSIPSGVNNSLGETSISLGSYSNSYEGSNTSLSQERQHSSGGRNNNGQRQQSKTPLEIMNQQLTSSLTMSIANLPNVHVIGNFTNSSGGMETIVEDDDGAMEEGMDYFETPPGTPSRREKETPLRISSALDRIVTRARAEIPFRPTLPGSVPEEEDLPGDLNSNWNKNSRRQALRRNSAPSNF